MKGVKSNVCVKSVNSLLFIFREVDFSRVVPQVEVVVREVEVVVGQRHLEVRNDQVMLPVVQHQNESLAVMISQLMLI